MAPVDVPVGVRGPRWHFLTPERHDERRPPSLRHVNNDGQIGIHIGVHTFSKEVEDTRRISLGQDPRVSLWLTPGVLLYVPEPEPEEH